MVVKVEITIESLQYKDAGPLFEFELKNRHYFEKMVPSRGEEYYNYESFLKRHESLLKEQSEDLSYFYLIKDQNSNILGRINLVDITKNGGDVGYRIGEENIGKGIAQKALTMLIQTAKNKGIKQISAKTTNNNIASQKVLEKKGFRSILLRGMEIIWKWFLKSVPNLYTKKADKK